MEDWQERSGATLPEEQSAAERHRSALVERSTEQERSGAGGGERSGVVVFFVASGVLDAYTEKAG